MCKITITTKTYNREHLLPRAVESVLNQTFTDFEYIILNNGSTDNTQSIIDHYCKLDARVRSLSFPVNIRHSDPDRKKEIWDLYNESAKYLIRIDDDDFMEPNTVETLYRLITEYDADIASVGSKFVYPDGSTKDKFVFEGTYVFNRIEAMVEMLKREKFNTSMGGKIFRKEVQKNITVPKVEVTRDIYSGYRKLNNIKRMVVTGTPLYYFYRHENNLSGLDTAEQITPEKMRQHLDANKIRTEWLTEHMPEIKDFVLYCELSFMISLYERIHRLDVQSCFGIAKEMKEILVNHKSFLFKCEFLTEKEKEIVYFMQIER